MTQVLVDKPQNHIATVREFVDTYSGKDMISPAFATTTYTTPLEQSRQYFPTSIYTGRSDWESFENELEFE